MIDLPRCAVLVLSHSWPLMKSTEEIVIVGNATTRRGMALTHTAKIEIADIEIADIKIADIERVDLAPPPHR